jgi:hypothetical protein
MSYAKEFILKTWVDIYINVYEGLSFYKEFNDKCKEMNRCII